VVTFHQDTLVTPPPSFYKKMAALEKEEAKEGGTGRLIIHEGLYSEDCAFRFLNGRVEYTSTYTEGTVKRLLSESTPFIRTRDFVYSPEGTEVIIQQGTGKGEFIGTIVEHRKLPNVFPIDIALGLRFGPDMRWINDDDINHAVIEITPGKSLRTRSEIPHSGKVVYEWELDSLQHEGLTHFVAKLGDLAYLEIVASQFETIRGVALPHHVLVTRRAPGSAGAPAVVVQTVTLHNLKYEVGGNSNSVGSYQLRYPADTPILDMRGDAAVPTTRP